MADRTVNGLHGCQGSLGMTVLPCVTQAADSLAREQVALVVKYLGFVSQRVHLVGDRVRFELRCDLGMAESTARALQRHGRDASALARLCDEARRLMAWPDARQQALEAVSTGLRTEVSRTVRALPGGDRALRREVEAIVVEASRPLIEFQRAWFAPQAWESDTEGMPDVETLLADAAGTPPGRRRRPTEKDTRRQAP